MGPRPRPRRHGDASGSAIAVGMGIAPVGGGANGVRSMSQTGLPAGTRFPFGRQRDWEDQFHVWGSPPGQRELTRCENAVKEVREAIRASQKLSSRSIRVFPQGSYRNRVNVRQDSDVDVGVECSDTFFYELPPGTSTATFNITPSTYDYAQFKSEVGEALVAHFGSGAVLRGSKAFDIKATQRQVAADVAPFFQHRRYKPDGTYFQGVELRPALGSGIVNWPEQHYERGVDKHSRTGDRFKKVVRILKCLRNEMDEKGHLAAKPIPSFLVECLVFNAPNNLFGHTKWAEDVVGMLNNARQSTSTDALCGEWVEVSGFKWLFRGNQKWTRQQAHEFLGAAEAYIRAG